MALSESDSSQGSQPLVRGRKLTVRYGSGWKRCVAVDRLDIDVRRGRALGLVGESGCGKTTLGRALLRLVSLSKGKVEFDGVDTSGLGRGELRSLRRRMQMIFQDSVGSLNPRMRVGAIVGDPLVAHAVGTRSERRDRVAELLDRVGLDRSLVDRYPHELSGGQRQRVGLARALALDPEFIVCDEPLSALDVPAQAELMELFQRFRLANHRSYVFITHNLALAWRFCDEVAVMYAGRIVEIGSARSVLIVPAHPYTLALRDVAPRIDPQILLPSAGHLKAAGEPRRRRHGCSYADRCPHVTDICWSEEPELSPPAGRPIDHRVACHHPVAVDDNSQAGHER